jgi:hypothetical protein
VLDISQCVTVSEVAERLIDDLFHAACITAGPPCR